MWVLLFCVVTFVWDLVITLASNIDYIIVLLSILIQWRLYSWWILMSGICYWALIIFCSQAHTLTTTIMNYCIFSLSEEMSRTSQYCQCSNLIIDFFSKTTLCSECNMITWLHFLSLFVVPLHLSYIYIYFFIAVHGLVSLPLCGCINL